MHKIPLTSMEEDGLRNHRLPIGTPSQLSDCFRQGMAWALSQASHVVELKVDYLPPQQAAVRDILSGIDATENESPDGWWETTTGADFGKWKLDEVLAVLEQAAQPVALTVDDIMGLAAAMLRAGPNYDGTISELRAAVAALVAERDLAVHEQDTAQESLRRHQMWLQEAQAERDALRQDVQRLSEALRQEIDPPTFMGEPVSLLRKPVKSIADIKECYCPQDKCQAPVIMGRQTPCIRKMKEQK